MKRLRRRALEPGEFDALALAAANRTIVRLEMAHAKATRELIRTVEEHRDGCTHAQQLGRARFDLDVCQERYGELYGRFRAALAQLRAYNEQPTQTLPVIDAAQEPR